MIFLYFESRISAIIKSKKDISNCKYKKYIKGKHYIVIKTEKLSKASQRYVGKSGKKYKVVKIYFIQMDYIERQSKLFYYALSDGNYYKIQFYPLVLYLEKNMKNMLNFTTKHACIFWEFKKSDYFYLIDERIDIEYSGSINIEQDASIYGYDKYIKSNLRPILEWIFKNKKQRVDNQFFIIKRERDIMSPISNYLHNEIMLCSYDMKTNPITLTEALHEDPRAYPYSNNAHYYSSITFGNKNAANVININIKDIEYLSNKYLRNVKNKINISDMCVIGFNLYYIIILITEDFHKINNNISSALLIYLQYYIAKADLSIHRYVTRSGKEVFKHIEKYNKMIVFPEKKYNNKKIIDVYHKFVYNDITEEQPLGSNLVLLAVRVDFLCFNMGAMKYRTPNVRYLYFYYSFGDKDKKIISTLLPHIGFIVSPKLLDKNIEDDLAKHYADIYTQHSSDFINKRYPFRSLCMVHDFDINYVITFITMYIITKLQNKIEVYTEDEGTDIFKIASEVAVANHTNRRHVDIRKKANLNNIFFMTIKDYSALIFYNGIMPHSLSIELCCLIGTNKKVYKTLRMLRNKKLKKIESIKNIKEYHKKKEGIETFTSYNINVKQHSNEITFSFVFLD